jgi:hypothetical protein
VRGLSFGAGRAIAKVHGLGFGAGRAIAKVRGLNFGFSRSFFNSTNLKREFMGNVHGARTIFFCHIRGLLQQRNNRATGVFGYEISLWPCLRCGRERNDAFGLLGGMLTHRHSLHQHISKNDRLWESPRKGKRL